MKFEDSGMCKEVTLKHNYDQFYGCFFLWLYISFEEATVPKYWKFSLPDGRIIFASTEITYKNTADYSKGGIESIKRTRGAQLIRTAYSAPTLKVKDNGAFDFCIAHAAEYYTDKTIFVDTNINLFGTTTVKRLLEDGFVKMLILSKIKEIPKNIYEETAKNNKELL